MKEQKYHKGDHVMVAKDSGPSMSHFENDCEAIILYSYNDEYGGGNVSIYGIYIKGRGQVAWYDESQLKLIELNRMDILKIWEKENQDEIDLKSNIDWIFENSESVLKEQHWSSISKLAECFGLNNLWGSKGEGFVWYENAMQTFKLAEPFLKEKNKKGWLDFCEQIK
ncbi:MAG: hypothetical protein GY941_23445 [Planctomycetes bacterium]|nr:hypothetical protein [Planctomycetota bacterium]